MIINSVQLQENGYLVNGNISVPDSPANRHYQMIQEWIAEGNTPEPNPTESFENKQKEKLSELETAFTTESKKPLTTSLGIDMDCRELDAQRFTMSMVEAQATGSAADRQVVDYYNVTHTVTYAEFVQVAMEVGAKWKDMFINKKQANRKKIMDAETPAGLLKVTFDW